jgi:Cdc6-like AAA superfamily ATPase
MRGSFGKLHETIMIYVYEYYKSNTRLPYIKKVMGRRGKGKNLKLKFVKDEEEKKKEKQIINYTKIYAKPAFFISAIIYAPN